MICRPDIRRVAGVATHPLSDGFALHRVVGAGAAPDPSAVVRRRRLRHRRGYAESPIYLAAIRMLFDWLVTGQVVPLNPTSAVKGPSDSYKKVKSPILDAESMKRLIESIDPRYRDHHLS